MNKKNQQLLNSIEEEEKTPNNDSDLFAEEVEDRFNAKIVSSGGCASSVGSTWGTLSSVCSAI